MIKNLLLTILLTTFNVSNQVVANSDEITIEGVSDFIEINAGFIDFYNTYSNYGDIEFQLPMDSIEICIDTGINEFSLYPISYWVFDNYIRYSFSSANSNYLDIYTDLTYELSYQGLYSNFQDVYMYVDTTVLDTPNFVLKTYLLSYSGEMSYNFNNNINYNAPYNRTRSPYIVIDNNAGMPRWDKTINLGYFTSNGTIYTEMIMTYKRIDNAYPTYFTNNQSTGLVGGEDSIFKGADGLYYASELSYYNRFTQLSTRVWLRNGTYLGDKYVIANGGTWVNSNYRTFTILGDFAHFTETEKVDTLEILGLLNDGQFIEVVPPSNEITNVFDLLTSAFNSLGGLLNITIFPGITLGVLLCIPIFALVLLFVIGLFKR